METEFSFWKRNFSDKLEVYGAMFSTVLFFIAAGILCSTSSNITLQRLATVYHRKVIIVG